MKKTTKILSHLPSFIKSESGAFAIFFAISLPFMIGFGAVAIDGTHVLNTRVRLSAAADEAALAVAIAHNKNESTSEQEYNRTLAENYVNYYTGNRGELKSLNVEYKANNSTYYVTTVYDAQMLLSTPALTGYDKYMTVGNDRLSSGIATKIDSTTSSDVTFVLDFSSSTTCDTSISSCNLWSSTSGTNTRADLLKTVVNSILSKYKTTEGIQFSVVPFDTGVPFRPEQAVNITNLKTKNEVGGEQVGCSVPYTLLQPYNKIDFSFWANKYLDFEFSSSIRYESKYYNRTFYNMDGYRYLYYSKVVGPSMGLTTGAQLVAAGICKDNGANTTIVNAKYRYTCEVNADESIFTTANVSKVTSQYNYVLDLMNLMYWNASSARKGEFSIANGGSIDFDNTLKNIFKSENIIEFYQPTSPNVLSQRPFTGMCQSAQAGPDNLLRDTDENETSSDPLYQRASQLIKNSQSQTYLIPLTKDVTGKNELITNFNKMLPGGGTDEMSGLLRAAPMAAQGTGLQKIIIVISDGDNNETRNLPASLSTNSSITEVFLNKGVCQVIRDKLDDVTKTQHNLSSLDRPSEIHYVSLNAARTDDHDMWLKGCSDNDPQYVHDANDISDLIDLIDTIIVQSETGYLTIKK
ncbi:TadE/TadG family type IV pilus assembly protein [Zophobihabitans entericus]|uniref:Putative Flp pilus-assembly TadG-like N-terminal domain-containing protein n=1 Tax=Zophobihabitans entericus TaxID=1635327 RepID=A0A6G9IAS1_9GAMM|nr:pilus assembly protein TadG-related protein [Zophobihabitans entericus]QIQ21313.1 hypothetical protein IPMB12_06205 [Zophobihabitans entericus]